MVDKGTWSYGKTDDGRFYLESSDFQYDARLYIDADFCGEDEKCRYAEDLCKRLNSGVRQTNT